LTIGSSRSHSGRSELIGFLFPIAFQGSFMMNLYQNIGQFARLSRGHSYFGPAECMWKFVSFNFISSWHLFFIPRWIIFRIRMDKNRALTAEFSNMVGTRRKRHEDKLQTDISKDAQHFVMILFF